MQLAPSLHRVGSDLVAAYLVEEGGAITVIDAGLPGLYRELEAEVATMGRAMADVRAVVLTHGDSDHVGFAERLRRDHGVPIHVHAADAPRARGETNKGMAGAGRIRVLPLLRFLAYSGRRGGLRPTWVGEVVPVDDGATLDLPGSPRIIGLPGHTPGSVAIHLPTVDAVAVGDALTTGNVLTGHLGPGPAPFTLDRPAALAALERIEGLGVRWVLPGHGAPWDGGVAEAVRRVREAAAIST